LINAEGMLLKLMKRMNFIELNKKICKKIGSIFPNTKFDIYRHYVDLVKNKLSDGYVVLVTTNHHISLFSCHFTW
jgi:hypothetical protein